MVTSIYVIGVILFAVTFHVTRLSRSFGHVVRTSRETVAAIRDPALDDDAKERIARQSSLRLLRQGVAIIFKSLLTLAAAVAPFWIADLLELKPWSETIAFASRWDVLAVTTVAAILIVFAWRRWTARAH